MNCNFEIHDALDEFICPFCGEQIKKHAVILKWKML